MTLYSTLKHALRTDNVVFNTTLRYIEYEEYPVETIDNTPEQVTYAGNVTSNYAYQKVDAAEDKVPADRHKMIIEASCKQTENVLNEIFLDIPTLN